MRTINTNTVTFQRASKRPRISKEKDEVPNNRRTFSSHNVAMRSAETNPAEAKNLQPEKSKIPVNITYTASSTLVLPL